jgi:Thrombospondin type 3 repeat
VARKLLAFVLALGALALPSAASASSVTPQFAADNPSCADFGLKGLKVDRSDVAGDYSDGTLSVHIEQAGNGGKITSWTSNIGVDKVILKGGAGGSDGDAGSNVYTYNPEATGDTDLVVPNGTALSHIEFCYDTGDTPPPNQCGSSDMDSDGVNDSCDNCPSVANPGQQDSNGNGMGDACEQISQETCQQQHAGETDTDGDGVVDACDSTPNGSTSNNTTSETPQQTAAPEQQQGSAPAADQGNQLVLGERVSAGRARLIAATGCASRTFSARVRGSQIKRVVFRLDGKRIATVTKRNKAGLYAARINPAKYRIGVHRLVVIVTFNSASRTKARTLRASFQRCAHRLVAPRFTG